MLYDGIVSQSRKSTFFRLVYFSFSGGNKFQVIDGKRSLDSC